MAKPAGAERYRHVIIPSESKKRPRVFNVATPATCAAEPQSSLSEENIELLEWLFRQVGLELAHYRTDTLKRRLPACLRALRVRSAYEARRLLEEDGSFISIALDAMLVGVTWFFRDPAVFDTLRKLVLPTLAEGRKNLYAWSVGCSAGAELYSLAMLLADMNVLRKSYLLGTDCRAEAIQRARLGHFDVEAVKCVPASLLEHYMTRTAAGWEALPLLRAALHWRAADALKCPEPGVWDLILCRNTAMYLRGPALTALFEKLESLLRPGGVLVLGKAERPEGVRRLSFVAPCIYRRNRG